MELFSRPNFRIVLTANFKYFFIGGIWDVEDMTWKIGKSKLKGKLYMVHISLIPFIVLSFKKIVPEIEK